MGSEEDRAPNLQSSGSTGSDGGERSQLHPASSKERAPSAVGTVGLSPPAVQGAGSDERGKEAQGSTAGGEEAMKSKHGKRRGRPPKRKEMVGESEGPTQQRQRPRKVVECNELGLPKPCRECGKKFSTREALSLHMKNQHGRHGPQQADHPPVSLPPPSPVRDAKQQGEKLISDLPSTGQITLPGAPEEGGQEAAGGASSNQQAASATRPRGLDIDLNAVPIPSDPSSPETEAANQDIDVVVEDGGDKQ